MKNENGKILGVIGGMGPAATQLFYRMIIDNTNAHSDQEHLNMIILNHATMPDRTAAIMDGNVDRVLDKLAADAAYLEQGGATCIAIPCNTTHAVMDKLQARVNIPIINMIDETAAYVAELLGAESSPGNADTRSSNSNAPDDTRPVVGIMATSGNIKMELYQNACRKYGLTPVIPSPERQDTVMRLIYDGIKNGGEVKFSDFEDVAGELEDKGAQRIILGCTELSVIREMFNLTDFYVDAMQVLARRSLKLCGK